LLIKFRQKLFDPNTFYLPAPRRINKRSMHVNLIKYFQVFSMRWPAARPVFVWCTNWHVCCYRLSYLPQCYTALIAEGAREMLNTFVQRTFRMDKNLYN